MAYLKKKEEIEKILEGGRILGEILEHLATLVEPGRSGDEIDKEAEKRIRAAGGVPAFKGYKPSSEHAPFPSTICFSVNDEVVHGIPTKKKKIQEGDVVSLDIGMRYPTGNKKQLTGNSTQAGFFTDTALTVAVGEVSKEIQYLLAATEESLYLGIAAAVPGGTVGDIGKAVESFLKPKGYGIVRDLCGHGVGHAVHEDPNVLNYYDRKMDRWVLEPGVVIAIEPMVTLGGWQVEVKEDGWAIATQDGSMSAHFEHTVVITEEGPVIATRRPSEKR